MNFLEETNTKVRIGNTKINKIFGSKTAFKKCIDISDDKEKLIEFYHKLKAQKEHYTFYHLKSEEDFLDTLDKIFAYSKSTRIYMVPDANGNMDAASQITEVFNSL